MAKTLWLASRKLLAVRGTEAAPFLQGLLTNDIGLAKPNALLYAFILNAKGRIVHELLIYAPRANEYLLEVDKKAATSLERMLKLYRLRRKIDIELLSDTRVGFSPTAAAAADVEPLVDPRVSDFGYRLLASSQSDEADAADEKNYMRRRLEWGIAEGHDELYDQLPLNANGDITNAINFDKGCYVGQELVARTHHTGIIRRRIVPFRCDGTAAGFIIDENARKQGKVLRCDGKNGIGILARKRIGQMLHVNGIPIETYRPCWWPAAVQHYPETTTS